MAQAGISRSFSRKALRNARNKASFLRSTTRFFGGGGVLVRLLERRAQGAGGHGAGGLKKSVLKPPLFYKYIFFGLILNEPWRNMALSRKTTKLNRAYSKKVSGLGQGTGLHTRIGRVPGMAILGRATKFGNAKSWPLLEEFSSPL
jgi:hypothetical protein